MSHTPGPWHAEENPYVNGWGVYADSERLGPGQIEPDLVIVAVDLSEANARLIAAAPDLLTALCALVVEVQYHGDWLGVEIEPTEGLTDALNIARTAIAKATGEASS